jgi:hypothetical protein
VFVIGGPATDERLELSGGGISQLPKRIALHNVEDATSAAVDVAGAGDEGGPGRKLLFVEVGTTGHGFGSARVRVEEGGTAGLVCAEELVAIGEWEAVEAPGVEGARGSSC